MPKTWYNEDEMETEECKQCGEEVPENSHPPDLCDSCAWERFTDFDGDDLDEWMNE